VERGNCGYFSEIIKRWKANLVGHTLHRNCPLKHIIEGKMDE
jgi:hypothetical protein